MWTYGFCVKWELKILEKTFRRHAQPGYKRSYPMLLFKRLFKTNNTYSLYMYDYNTNVMKFSDFIEFFLFTMIVILNFPVSYSRKCQRYFMPFFGPNESHLNTNIFDFELVMLEILVDGSFLINICTTCYIYLSNAQ